MSARKANLRDAETQTNADGSRKPLEAMQLRVRRFAMAKTLHLWKLSGSPRTNVEKTGLKGLTPVAVRVA